MMTNSNFELALRFLSELDGGRQDFTGIDLRDSILERLTLRKGSVFKSANFQGCRLNFSIMSACNFNTAIFDGASLLRVVFSGSYLKRASFQGAELSHSNFMKCRLLNADFRKADLSGANLAQSDLRGADFREVNLSQTELRGAFYDENTLFDMDVVPTSLNMRFVEQEQEPANSAPVSSVPKLTYRGAAVDTTDTQSKPVGKAKKPLMMFRGAVQEAPEPQDSPPDQSKAQKTQPKKIIRTYRGVPIE